MSWSRSSTVNPRVSIGRPDRHRHRRRPDQLAALAHGRPTAVDGDRHDWRLRLQRHDEPALLEGQELARAGPGAFREDQEGVAGTQRLGTARHRRQRRLAVVALHGHEPAEDEHASQQRQLRQLGLVEDVQAAVQHLEQHRRVDVALVVRAEDHGPPGRQVLTPANEDADAGKLQADPGADVAEVVEQPVASGELRDQDPRRRGDQHVDGDCDKRRHRANGRDERLQHVRRIDSLLEGRYD